MSVHTVNAVFGIQDQPTLLFMEHCLNHWLDEATCTNAHVSFMKHLARHVFGLPAHMQLMGIRFGDETLAMVSPLLSGDGGHGPFFVLSRCGEGHWQAVCVRVRGFTPHWGLEMGFWEGLHMEQQVLTETENTGPRGEQGD